ncbi:hypothetical protein ACLB2K_059081 [Fragaria x ananassa]
MQTSSSSPLQTILDLINETLSLLLRTSLTVRSFPSRWHPLQRRQPTSAVSLLAATNDESRKAVFEEGGLGPLLRILESGTTTLKEKAAIAVEALTADLENAWAVSAYSGEKRGEGFALIAGKE